MKLLCAGVIAFLLKLFLASSTAGTNDVRTWEHDLTTLRTVGFAELYRWGVQYDVQYDSPSGRLSQRQAFIHPPAVLRGLRILGNRFWLRATCALADAGTLALLWIMFRSRAELLIIALSPISILISGFHGNTDPIMMFFLVAAVFFAERGHAARGGIAFGLACSVKLISLIFAPAILLCLPGLRPRLKWLAASAVVWFALSLPYLAQEPVLILRSMLGYSGATGLWGLSLISTLHDSSRMYDSTAKWIALLAAACLPFMMKRRLFEQCGLIAFLFLLLSPGFGFQYLAWTLPWTVVYQGTLHRRDMLAYHSITAAAALTVYAAASQHTSAGVYADLLNPAHFPVLILMGMVCWITIGVSMAILWVGRNPALPATLGDPGSIESVPDY